MMRGAWLTCALLVVAHARIYERCELARDLQSLGVDPRHISTWVCIAFHESRFDTAARNPNSGDHGIFQISELFWCGPGKVCDLPCSALRDEDISNDLECALKIYEEHTRLQGDGFRAWVVYPSYCAHNTKKYLVDCDINVKYSVPITRDYTHEDQYLSKINNTRDGQVSLPPYLVVSDILRGYYGKMLDQTKGIVDWYNYKINNIDDLEIPSSFTRLQEPVTTPSTTTIMTTTEYFPPVIPWRRIETNQFRKKQTSGSKTNKQTVNWKENISTKFNNTEYSQTTTQTQSTVPTTPLPLSKITNSYATHSSSTRMSTVTLSTVQPVSMLTWRPTSMETTIQRRHSRTTSIPYGITTPKSYFIPRANISREVTSIEESTNKPKKESSLATTSPSIFTTKTTIWTTPRPTTTKKAKTEFPTTKSTTENLSTTVKAIYLQNTPATYEIASQTSRKPTADFSRLISISRTETADPIKLQSSLQTITQRPNQSVALTTKQTTTRKPRITQSIFDLYLNPTKPPTLRPLQLDSLPASKYRLKIFSGGTTSPAPSKRT